MIKSELKEHVGKFGIIRAGDIGFKKTLPGNIKEIDARGNIYFVDNDGYSFIFTPEQVDTFEPREFVVIKEKPIDIMTAKKKTPKQPSESVFKIFFTQDDKEDYFIIEGETTEKAYNTAKDVLKQRGLDYEKNNVYSQQIK
jgi:hypothetical protein